MIVLNDGYRTTIARNDGYRTTIVRNDGYRTTIARNDVPGYCIASSLALSVFWMPLEE